MPKNLFNSFNDPVPPFRYDVQMVPVKQNGETFLYFHDQMGYTSPDFAVPYSAQTIFSLLDGNRSIAEIKGFSNNGITKEQILEYVQFLDENALLQSDYFKEIAEEIESKYEESDIHISNTAGFSYPEDAEELKDFLNEAFTKLETVEPVEKAKALYAPHIDPRVGLNSYVKAFSSIKDLTPKRVVILATSHYSSYYSDLYDDFPFVISSKNFQLVNGEVKADRPFIEQLRKKTADNPQDFGISFHDRAHRIEHSVELHLLFLNHLWNHDFEIVPILVGGLDELFYKADGFRGQQVQKFTSLLADYFSDDETFFLISGDLAHIGKKFGDQNPATEMFDEVKNFDRDFLKRAANSNPKSLLNLMAEEYDPYRICGYPPLYVFLNTFPGLDGKILTYDLWDEKEQESAVTFGSILYR